MNRRAFLTQTGLGLGSIALANMLNSDAASASVKSGGVLPASHHAQRAKRVIFLFQSGGPSHLDLYDYKPTLVEKHGYRASR